MQLPIMFEKRMQDMLKEEYPAFIKSYENEKYQALRINPLKTDADRFLETVPFTLTPVLWEKNGFYYETEDKPGKHPWHEAGVYYIQEPSAMAPAAYMGVKPGERILDLCAAPGGKSTQLASYLNGEGLLVCNEIHPARAKILSENIERMGIRNALVTNETPQKLASHFVEYFDRILVDAPCSGEGMFRKNEAACGEWSLENVELCAQRQDEILDLAAKMLRLGGRLVYSTCTFAPAENEGSISRFLERNPEFHILEVPKYEGMQAGNSDWVQEGFSGDGIENTIRLWPQHLKGEGHYLAVLQKGSPDIEADWHSGICIYGEQTGLFSQSSVKEKNVKNKNHKKGQSGVDLKDFYEFCRETLFIKNLAKESDLQIDDSRLLLFGEQLYLMPSHMPSINGLKVLRPGLHLGTLKKNRFEPAHALALTLSAKDVQHVMNLTGDDSRTMAFINGQTLICEADNMQKGWYLITVDGYSLGWGKLTGTVMKNHYPKGLRK